MRYEDDRQPVGGIVALEAQTESAEETLHAEKCEVGEEVEGPKSSGRAVEADHEVYDDVVDKDPAGGERHVGEQVGDGEGGSTVHAIARLDAMTSQ